MGSSCLEAFSGTVFARFQLIQFIISFQIHISIFFSHLNLESINSSGFPSFHTASISEVFVKNCTINLCLLFSLGS
uniref:Uncharacterized protein n=3 Tax=Canis lupus TaxID=9612 RepID=A0A8C0S410_CANLF